MGTVAVVGISTKDAPLECHGYVGLLGSDEQSWGWNLVDNHLLHNGDTQGHYPLLNNCPKYQVSNYFNTQHTKLVYSSYDYLINVMSTDITTFLYFVGCLIINNNYNFLNTTV